jgi:hypothetical protein
MFELPMKNVFHVMVLLNSCATAWISQQELSDPPALDPNFYKKQIKWDSRIDIQSQDSHHALLPELKTNTLGHQELSPKNVLHKMNQLDLKTATYPDLLEQENPAVIFAAASLLHRNSPDKANKTANASSR